MIVLIEIEDWSQASPVKFPNSAVNRIIGSTRYCQSFIDCECIVEGNIKKICECASKVHRSIESVLSI